MTNLEKKPQRICFAVYYSSPVLWEEKINTYILLSFLLLCFIPVPLWLCLCISQCMLVYFPVIFINA